MSLARLIEKRILTRCSATRDNCHRQADDNSQKKKFRHFSCLQFTRKLTCNKNNNNVRMK